MKLAAGAALLLWVAVPLIAQEPEQDLCRAGTPITAVPNRPTVSNPAKTTQPGVLELEDGIAAAATFQQIQALLKFGLSCNFELRLGSNTWQHDATLHDSGLGDTTVGFKYRFLRQRLWLPETAIGYAAKLPTAGDILGSGEIDYQLTLLVSKDLGKSHFDSNLNVNWFGRRDRDGFDHDFLPTLSWTYPLTQSQKWQLEAELSGETSPAPAQPGSISNLYAVAYTLRPRLVLDSGVSFGLLGNIPRASFIAGFTYSIVDFYRLAHHN